MTVTVAKRTTQNSPLTWQQTDGNFQNLADGVNNNASAISNQQVQIAANTNAIAANATNISGVVAVVTQNATDLASGSDLTKGDSLVGHLAAGADAQPWTVQGKFGEQLYTVTDVMTTAERADALGKVGTMDVSAAFAKAFAKSLSIRVPSGRFYAPNLKIPTGATMVGDGVGATVLVGTAAASAEITGASKVALFGITFDTWNAALWVSPSLIDGLDVRGCEFVNCKKSVADRTDTTTTINAGKTVRNFNYTGNIDRNGEKGITLCCLVQVANVQFNTARSLSHATKSHAYNLGSEDGTDTVFDSYGITIANNDVDGISTTGVNAETHAVFLFGKKSVVASNKIRNVKNSNASSINGTEGIYCKAPDSVVENNYLVDAGLGQGSVTVKNKNTGTVRVRNNTIIYETVAQLTSPNFLVGIYGSEIGSFEAENNLIIGAQIPIWAAVSESVHLPDRIKIRNNSSIGDTQYGVYSGPAKSVDIEGNYAYHTNPASTYGMLGVYFNATTYRTDSLRIRRNESVGVKTGVSVILTGSATVGIAQFCDNIPRVDNSISGNRGISWSGAFDSISMTGNDLSSPTTKVVGGIPSEFICRNNAGYKSSNAGSSAITSAATFIDISHGLALTPRIQDISVTPANDLGSASKYWVSNVTANFFRINVNVAPGASTAMFSWLASAYQS